MKLINVRGSRRIAAGLCAGLCLLLPACRTQQTASSSEAGESSSSAARTAEPSSSSAFIPSADLTAEGMPPPAGLSAIEGRMLWPVEVVTGTEYSLDGNWYKFINEKGEPLTDTKYFTYSYIRDREGRCEYLTAENEDAIDVFTMDGKKIQSVKGEWLEIHPEQKMMTVCLERDFDPVFGYISRLTLCDLTTGGRLLQNDYTSITFVSRNTVRLVDADGNEYFCNLRQGESSRVLLEGCAIPSYTSFLEDSGDWLVCATDRPREEYTDDGDVLTNDVLYGYLGPDGKWAIPPQYEGATPFLGNYAGLKMPDGRWRFIDRQGNTVAGEGYAQISYSYYEVPFFEVKDHEWSSSASVRRLDRNLQPVKKEGWVNGAWYHDDQLIVDLPAEYSHIVRVDWPMILVSNNARTAMYLMNAESGVGKALPQYYSSIQKFRDWYIGYPDYSWQETVILDAEGNKLTGTVFQRFPTALENYWRSSNLLCEDYLWVTTGQYQGYVNINGDWVYRESRFQNLLD